MALIDDYLEKQSNVNHTMEVAFKLFIHTIHIQEAICKETKINELDIGYAEILVVLHR